MRRAEIAARFDEIVAFAEVERFLDTPVKRYSSGMYVRLAFAVAAHLEPEILIVDEVLAVGDAEFQSSCLGKMSDVAGAGRTVLFVSHNLSALRALCSRGLWLEGGRVAAEGPVASVVDAYLAEGRQRAETPLAQRRDRTGNGELRFTRAAVLAGSPPRPGVAPATGTPLSIALDYTSPGDAPLKNVRVAMRVQDTLGHRVFGTDTRLVNADFAELPRQRLARLRDPGPAARRGQLPDQPVGHRLGRDRRRGGRRAAAARRRRRRLRHRPHHRAREARADRGAPRLATAHVSRRRLA